MDVLKVEWLTPPDPPVINDEEVHVWRIDHSDFVPLYPELVSLLSADERQRLERYHFVKDRNRFAIGRGILRRILAHYSGAKPSELSFSYNSLDKPYLEGQQKRLSFNISFSKGIQLAAIASNMSVGIDVEFIDTSFPALEVAKQYFSREEITSLRDLQPDLQTAAFFDCWTKKEAYTKGVGEGLSHPLPEMTIVSGSSNSFSVSSHEVETTGWSVMSFVPAPGFVASLACEACRKTIRYFHWPWEN
jgi:4'-phosphopantetheinyl transferase